MNIKTLLLIPLLLLLLACSEEHTLLYGAPTTMVSGESPVDTICRIQSEFRELPKPVMDSMNYVYPWTSRKFGAATVEYDGYDTVQLTQEGLDFLQRHSRLELVVSLTPLFAEQGIGGEAAALLAGIPAGDKSAQRGKTAALAAALAETYYRQPKRPGDWYDNAANYYSRVRSLYGHINQTEAIHQKLPDKLVGSLEAKIIQQLDNYGRAPYKLFNERPYMPQPHNIESIRKLVANNLPPQLSQRALEYIESKDTLFSALVLFPYLPSPQQSGLNRDQILMMYMLGMEDKYWPAIMQLSSGQKEINQLRDEFKKIIPKKFERLCQYKMD